MTDWLRLAELSVPGLDLKELPSRSVLKFGARGDVGTSLATVGGFGGTEAHETLATSNAISHISSGSGSDTTQTVTVAGHTISGSALTPVTQTVALTGQTKAALGTALARVERAYVSAGATDLAGVVYVFEDDTLTDGVPDTDNKVHLTIPVGDNQSLKSQLAVADGHYLIVTAISGSVTKKTDAIVEFKLQKAKVGGVWRTQYTWTASTDGSSSTQIRFEPHLVVEPNSDVRVVAIASAASTPVSAQIHGVMATDKDR